MRYRELSIGGGKLPSIHPGHFHVQQNQARIAWSYQCQRLLAAVSYDDGVSLFGKAPFNHLGDTLVVFDDENWSLFRT
jgi:hypothetical protein